MTKQNKIWSAIIIIITLSAISYFSFNINIFKHRKEIQEKSFIACQNKELDESCNFSIKNKNLTGTCKESRNNELRCISNLKNKEDF